MRPSLVKPASADAAVVQRGETLRRAAERRKLKRAIDGKSKAKQAASSKPQTSTTPAPSPSGSASATPRPSATTDMVPTPRAAAATATPRSKLMPLTTPVKQRHVHLLQRATYGPTVASLADVARMGTGPWVEAQLNPSTLPDPVGDRIRATFPEMGRGISATRDSLEEFSWDSMFALGQGTLALAIWSSRQLQEVMVDFWSNHLNVTSPSDSVWDNRADYDARVIRPHALGKFSDMLVASATHPAMLNYLNNASSTKDSPNENYGRELLELHTVGIDTNYGENGVLNSARIMTGWTLDWDNGLAVYDPNIHWVGPVSVLGFTHANSRRDGRAVVTAYVNYLARRPQTAKRIAFKLGQRFVSDAPPSSLVDRLANVYLSSDTDIRPVLRTLFNSPEFWSSSRQKVKRPMEDLTSTVRTMGHRLLPTSASTANVRSGVEALYWMTWDQQNAPHGWSLPTGYPDVAVEWASAELAVGKINSHRLIAESWWPDETKLSIVRPKALLPKPMPSSYGALIDQMAVRLIGAPLNSTSKTAILKFFGKTRTSRIGTNDEIRTWGAGALIALILDSPTAAMR